MVIECMAIQPEYQEWSEKMVIQAHIGVITNVREDHQDVMGETLPEIAVSLAKMCPTNGYLIVAEYEPELQAILRDEAHKRGSQLIVADPTRVSDEENACFDYLSFKENVAIGLSVADLLGIDHETAMRGMLRANGDAGVMRLQPTVIDGKPVLWANMFAVNDRESMIISLQKLDAYHDEKVIKIGILNNRYDRERRAEQFSDVAAKDLCFDYLITFGAYETLVTQKLRNNNFPPDHIINLGDGVKPSLDQILEVIGSLIPDGSTALLVGFVNIHTPQAELLINYFESVKIGQELPTEVLLNATYQSKRHTEAFPT
jgi:poly-gamma-glutamate synthase PgsB/CapB